MTGSPFRAGSFSAGSFSAGSFRVDSEVGRLRQVILHRPGTEMLRLTPGNKDRLLFDDVLWVHRAQQEHDRFAEVLREQGVTVHLFADLLRNTLEVPEARRHVLDRIFDERVYGPMAIDALRNAFDALETDELTDHLVGGITKRELLDRVAEPRSIVLHALGPDDFVLEPLPNHLYTRDASAWIGTGVSVNSMRKIARMRETANYEAVYRWHPLFAEAGFPHWSDGVDDGVATTEGGDILVVGNGAVLVGLSERTTPAERRSSGVTSTPSSNRSSADTFTGVVWVRNGPIGIDFLWLGPRSLPSRM